MIIARETALYREDAISDDMRRAKALATGKSKVFYTESPAPPYKEGDLWVFTYKDDENRDVLEVYTCINSKLEGTPFEESDWILSATDDHVALQALNIGSENSELIEYLQGLLASAATTTDLEAMEVDLSERIEDLDWYGYLKLYGRDGGTPVVVIGDENVVQYVMKATNQNIGFYKSGDATPITYFGKSALNNLFGLIANVLVADSYLTVGNFTVISNSDGGVTIKKVN